MDRRITPNFKDADIMQITEAVSAATGKNFIIDPRVRAQMTMLSSTPMSPDAFYQAFLWILQVQAAIETDRKYNYIRDEQRKVAGETEKLPLLPGVTQPLLPNLPPPSSSDRQTSAPTSPEEKEKASEAQKRSRLTPQARAAPTPTSVAPQVPPSHPAPASPPESDTGHP